MKTTSSLSIFARTTLALLLCLSGLSLLCVIPFAVTTRAQTQTSGTINSNGTGTNLTFMGNHVSPGGNIQESTCVDTTPAASCEVYTLTVTGTPAQWAAAGKKIQVLLTWLNGTNEYDIYIHQGNSVNGPLVTSAIQGPGVVTQVAIIDPSSAGTGTFTIHIAYDVTPTAATDHYTANISAITGCGGTGMSLPAPQDPNIPNGGIGYENFEAPGTLVTGTSTSSGAATVEYLGRNAGEPSAGANFNTGVINFESDLETLFVTFDDSCNLSNPKATWVNRRAPTQNFIDSDPISFTDRDTGRVFAGSLTLLSPDTPKVAYTDDDGLTWVPAPFMQGLASAVDHETIGGGHYHSPIPPNLPPYPNAVYYCSQDIGAAFCARSDGGGAVVGAQTPLYTLEQCGGLHGHVKVAPDGTAYVPNRSCLGGNSAVVVSTDNGTTWAVRPIQNAVTLPSSPSTDDPSVAIDAAGTVYALFSLNGTQATVAVSTDQGTTWTNIFDVGASFGVTNVAFPAAVAGDANRAAVAFYGSTNAGCDSSADQFSGVWHLYVAHTFDGGAHWTTTDVTPKMPMQRMGLLRGGGGPADRNLLDFFDLTMDRDGRVIVGYVNGCSGGPCSQAADTVTGNAYTTTATLARQSSGKRLLILDHNGNPTPTTSTSVPGMPFVTGSRAGGVIRLAWNEADTGNLPITNYAIRRSTTSGAETLLATINGSNTSFTDNTASDVTQTYYYQVVAKNSAGNSCRNNEIAVPYVGDNCSGLIIHRNLPSHPEATGNGATGVPTGTPTPTPTPTPPLRPQLLIDYVAVGEPPSHPGQLMFKMKVSDLSTLPNTPARWRMVWNWVGTAANPNADEQYFVGMTYDGSNPPTFEYGTVKTASLVVLGVPTEIPIGTPDPASNFQPDGTITIYIDKSAVGNPQVGDLLGAVNGRTFATGDDPSGNTLERSTLLTDHTFVKGNTDNAFPPATYTIHGNTTCPAGGIAPISAVSRKTHGSAGNFDIDLPLLGNPGIECRSGGAGGNYQVVVTFAVPVTVTSANVMPGTGTVSGSPVVNNTTVTINLTGVSNIQVLTLNLVGVSGGGNSGNVAIPMAVLVGDTTADKTVNSSDVSQTKAKSGQTVDLTNFRNDVTAEGTLNSSDVSLVKSKSGTALP